MINYNTKREVEGIKKAPDFSRADIDKTQLVI